MLVFLILTSPSLLVVQVSASPGSIDYAFVEVTTQQSSAGTSYVDVSGAVVSSSEFTAGKKYLLVFTAQVGDADTSANPHIRAIHGSTEFPGSEMSVEPFSASSHYTYFFYTVWTAASGESVKLQFRTQQAGDNVRADQITMFKMNLVDDLTEGTDWFFDEDTVGDTLSGTGWDGLASVTFTPSVAGNDWLVMATARIDPAIVFLWDNFESRISRSGEASSTQPEASQEGEDSTYDRFVQTLMRVYSLGAASNTFTQESRQDFSDTASRTYSSVFALNLHRFKNHNSAYTEGEVALSTSDFATQVQSISLTPDQAGDVWALGAMAIDVGSTGLYHKFRLQVDGADQPATQTSDSYNQGDSWDSTDEILSAMQTVESLSASSHAFDMDASAESSGPDAEDRSLFAVTMELWDWESYSDSARTTVSDLFYLDSSTVYMMGTGVAAGDYRVRYFDALGTNVATHDFAGFAGGKLNDTLSLPSYPSSEPGAWHARLYDISGAETFLADDAFTVEEVSVPDFPLGMLVLAIPVVAVFFYVRRRAGQ